MRTIPYALVTLFTVVIQGLSLSEFVPVPVALLIGLGWSAAIGSVAYLVSRRPRLRAWTEDVLVGFGCAAMALFAFGGAVGLLLWNVALDSPSVTGETMVAMFLPSIPIAIAANAPTELIVIPGLLILGWRPGIRRVLVVTAAALYFVHRVWSYLVFVGDRLDFAAHERATTALTAAERAEFAEGLHLNDPRWLLNLLLFVVFLVAAYCSRVRAVNGVDSSAGSASPSSGPPATDAADSARAARPAPADTRSARTTPDPA
jgi:hypothetical protein